MPDWYPELALVQLTGARLTPGLTAAEVAEIEHAFDIRFPDDLRMLLSTAVPSGDGWPEWRGDPGRVRHILAGPADGVLWDVEHNAFWWPAWGARPAQMRAALDLAAACLADLPQLIPVYSHRFMPSMPTGPGNPIFSVVQTDVIYYGPDLRQYLRHEFEDLPYAAAINSPRYIPFWSDLADVGGAPVDGAV